MNNQYAFASTILRRCTRLAVSAMMAWLTLCAAVAAGSREPTEQVVYQLHHVTAARAHSLLIQRIPDGTPPPRMMINVRDNQIRVEGTPAAQDMARKLIETLDRPASAPPAGDQHTAPAPRNPAWREKRLERLAVDEVQAVLADLFAGQMRAAPQALDSLPGWLVDRGRAGPLRVAVDRSTRTLVFDGPPATVSEVMRVLDALERPSAADGAVVRVIPLRHAEIEKVRRAVDAFRTGGRPPATTTHPAPGRADPGLQQAAWQGPPRPAATALAVTPIELHEQQPAQPPAQPPAEQPAQKPAPEPPSTEELLNPSRLRELGSDVEIEALPELDAIILRGNRREVEEMIRIIQEIERLSAEAEPEINVVPLDHVASQALATMIEQLSTDLLAGRQGRATVTALIKPNAVLVIGWGDALTMVTELIDKLDQPVPPDAQLRVFRLKHADAQPTADTVTKFFTDRGGLGTRVVVAADVRSNALLVQAGPRDMVELQHLLTRLDTPSSEAVNLLRVFRLQNTLAADLAQTMQLAIRGGTGAQGQPPGKSAALRFLTVDAAGQRLLESGILADVSITPDARTNTLLVSAPAENMELIAALIDQLDRLPTSVAQIKVFSIVNGDAASLVEMLRSLLGVQSTVAAGPELARAAGEESLAPLRFSVDPRTNTIIATGSAGDLQIVEAVLLRLDESDVTQRRNQVYRLSNAPALDVSRAINEFLRSERQVQQAAPGTLSPFRQIEAEVVVVAEPISNSLILSATPRYFEEIAKLIEDLDERPPQVLIQVLIAEVELGNTDEFGVELGIQDSLLFDRSLLGDLVTLTNTVLTPGGTVANQTLVGATNDPGYNFNNQQLGNSGATSALANSDKVGGQALSNFTVGRVNNELGFGGLVLAASSESVSVLIRALNQTRRLDVLSRPQVMTLDNQPAFIQVGERVPRVIATTISEVGQVNSIDLENVGLILGVTPRISPDRMVVMEIDAEKSELGSDEEGIPISISANGEVLRSPKVRTTTAQTTVSATSGQTIILGGLIAKSRTQLHRRVPLLADIPVLGNLFRYDLQAEARKELLIILTPHIVSSAEDAERVKQFEMARMHWCLADVEEIHGDAQFSMPGEYLHEDMAPELIYPDFNPRGEPAGPAPPEAPPGGPALPESGGAEAVVPEQRGLRGRLGVLKRIFGDEQAAEAEQAPPPQPAVRPVSHTAVSAATRPLPPVRLPQLPPTFEAGPTPAGPLPLPPIEPPGTYPVMAVAPGSSPPY